MTYEKKKSYSIVYSKQIWKEPFLTNYLKPYLMGNIGTITTLLRLRKTYIPWIIGNTCQPLNGSKLPSNEQRKH